MLIIENKLAVTKTPYRQLSLTGAILNADLAGSIAYSKLSLTGAILNADLAGSIADSKLASSYLYADGTRPLTGNWNMGAFTATFTKTGATAATVYDAFIASNTTPATVGNQMYSPAIVLEGRNWNTTAVASQPHRWRLWNQTVQSNAASGNLIIDANGNGGAYTQFMSINYGTGVVTIPFGISATSAASNLTALTSTGLTTLSRMFNSGSLRLGYRAITALRTLDNTDYFIDVTANSFTVTLPTAVSIAGTVYIIKNSGAGTTTIATTSSQTVDGSPPGTVVAGAVLRLMADGANWKTW